MDEQKKKEVKKVLRSVLLVILFIVVTAIFVLPYLVQVSTFFHERAHQKVLDKYAVENYYDINLLTTVPNFYNPKTDALGVTKFNLDSYRALSRYQKAEVNTAGIVSDLRLLILVGVYLALANVYVFYKVKIRKELSLTKVLAVNWIFFMWLIVLIQISVSNITQDSGDIYQLVRFISV